VNAKVWEKGNLKFLNYVNFFASQSLSSDQETKDMQDWLKSTVATVLNKGIQKLVTRCDKCLILLGD
jgi:hypothetical protein